MELVPLVIYVAGLIHRHWLRTYECDKTVKCDRRHTPEGQIDVKVEIVIQMSNINVQYY